MFHLETESSNNFAIIHSLFYFCIKLLIFFFVATQCLQYAFYLELTRLSEYGFRGRLFIISDSDPSYAREMAGT